MTDVVGTDIPQGPEVKWYSGGVSKTETFTHTDEATETLAKTAEYGSVIATLDGVPVGIEETGDEDAGTTAITVAAADDASGDLVVYYIDIQTTALTHIASCQDVKMDSSASTKTAAVHGQATKLNSVGVLENSADLEEFYYSQAFVKTLMGEQFSNSPASGKEKWTNKTSGVHKIGALVGKRRNTDSEVIYKWFLIGAQATGVSGTFPTEDMYKRSMKFLVDYWTECATGA